MRTRRRWSWVVALALTASSLVGVAPATADHTPGNPEGMRWKNDATNDFNLDVVWTNGYANRGAAYQARARDVIARDPSCFAGSCSTTSYARWYLDRADPYFGGAELTVADFDPQDPDPVKRCGTVGSVSFHSRTPSRPERLAETLLCRTDGDASRIFSAQVVVRPQPPSPSPPDPQCPGGYTWFTAGPGDALNDAPPCTQDLMSVLAHEVGHVLGLGHFEQLGGDGPSVDPACLNGHRATTEEQILWLGNNTNRETMCTPIYPGTERQRTPEEHEKDAFANLYPPTGPAPSISPASQTTTDGTAGYTVTVPKDPGRATSLYMIFGDGTYETTAIPQGTGSATFSFPNHNFHARGTYTQRARIVETGASSSAETTSAYLFDYECGHVIHGPGTYVLAGDLEPCVGDGIVIGGDNVTVDLNGHRVVGDGSTSTAVDGYRGLGDAGIRLRNVNGVRVTDSSTTCTAWGGGEVTGFDVGISIAEGSANTVEKLTVRDNIGSPESDYGDGVAITGSSGNKVIDNRVLHNGPFAGVGLYLLRDDFRFTQGNVIGRTGPCQSPRNGGNEISDNDVTAPKHSSFRAPGHYGAWGGNVAELDNVNSQDTSSSVHNEDIGVRIEPRVSGTTVENNLVERNGLDGIAVFNDDTSANVVRRNTVRHNGFHEYVGPTATGCPHGATTCGPDRYPRTAGPQPNSSAPGPHGYAQLASRKGDGIRVFWPNPRQNTIGGPTAGTAGAGGSGDGNLVCGNAASGIRVDGGARPPSFYAADKNTIKNNTSGGGTTTSGCAPNNVEVAPVPGAFDYYDPNTATNSTAGHPPCSSNLWGDGDPLVASSVDNKTFPASTRNHTCIS